MSNPQFGSLISNLESPQIEPSNSKHHYRNSSTQLYLKSDKDFQVTNLNFNLPKEEFQHMSPTKAKSDSKFGVSQESMFDSQRGMLMEKLDRDSVRG